MCLAHQFELWGEQDVANEMFDTVSQQLVTFGPVTSMSAGCHVAVDAWVGRLVTLSARGALEGSASSDHKVLIDGETFTMIRRKGALIGLSLRCPTCGKEKDLHYVASGMTQEEAVRRLLRWSLSCRPEHKTWGGRLLVDCVG